MIFILAKRVSPAKSPPTRRKSGSVGLGRLSPTMRGRLVNLLTPRWQRQIREPRNSVFSLAGATATVPGFCCSSGCPAPFARPPNSVGHHVRIAPNCRSAATGANLRLMGARRAGEYRGERRAPFRCQASSTCARRAALGSRVSDRGWYRRGQKTGVGDGRRSCRQTNSSLGLGHPVGDLREIVTR
jgi:hypothetical protein